MNDREFFENMDSITEELWRIASADSFDSDRWQGGVEKFYLECHNYYKRRLIAHEIKWLIYAVLIILLAVIVCKICL